MKKTVIAGALLCLTAGFSAPSFASDPCEVVLCMYGKFTGQGGGSDCNSAINEYFGIKVFKKGVFRPDKTATKRLNLLNSCPTADPSAVKSINNMFGRKMFG